ncbi:glutaredoxin family protein [Bacillus thermotolerans]|uniref:Glutaredoxin n=1 Tax=Bacillus thermotolerans TaxID=1221996 RepID=A0A0F5I807_BACTR|nr:glutaredoxin family protein [Bacillus thermotolerans]KKB41425.1 Glutaredoxin [Bacillus thermotolerans]
MNEVTVYSTNTCPYCEMMKAFLQAQDIPFKEVNVQQDRKAAQRLVETTGQVGVPQTNINGDWIFGFDPDAVMELIKK